MLREQHNAWVHAAATCFAVVLGFALEISVWEWAVIVLAIAGVWCAEALNTAFEALCDVVSPEFHPSVERAKDVAAAGVLIMAVAAAVIAVLIFGQRLWG